MKKTRKLMLFAALLILLLSFGVTAQAKTKVSKVQMTTTYKGTREYCTVKGLTSNGKTVWTYSSSAKTAQCTHVSWKADSKCKYVYVIDGRTYLKLNMQTGKIVKKKKKLFPSAMGSAVMGVDSSGNLYAMGYLSSVVYKINSNGKILWKLDLGDSVDWPESIKISGSKLTIRFESEWGQPKVVLNVKTGKLVG